MSGPAAQGRAARQPAASGAKTAATPPRLPASLRMRPATALPIAATVLLGVLLYARGLALGFVGDDFTLLDAALRHPLGELLTGRHGILGYYRPVSRELYFWGWGRLLGFGAGGFHAVNALTYAAVVVMTGWLARDLAGARAGRLTALAFLVFPAGSALLSWISCAQDLIALFWSLAALLLYTRGRHALAGVTVALAALSKETAAVIPAVLVALDVRLAPGSAAGVRLRRLAPAFAGLAAAFAVAVAARASWPAGTAVTIWSPRQLAGAWRLPFDFARTFLPPDTVEGVAQAWSRQPALLVLIAAAAALAVAPAVRPAATVPARGSAAAPGGAAGRAARTPDVPVRSAIVVGLALALFAMAPVGFIVERWRGYFFSLAAVGTSLALGPLLARVPVAVARGLAVLAAVVNFGAGGIYRPVEAPWGPARHPHVNYAFFRDTGALTDRLLAALEPWCEPLKTLPRTFAAAIPPDATFESVLGPGLRVTCRDTTTRVHFLADFTTADAARDFGVLRLDSERMRFILERADARVRALIGEGFLVHARYDVAAACFRAAANGAASRELSYPLAASLAAARRGAEAESLWRSAQRSGRVLDAATLASRMLGREPGGPGDTTGAAVRARAAAVLRAPWDADAQHDFGRALLEAGRGREAAFALSVAAGIHGTPVDVAWLGLAYEAMGDEDEAYAAYTAAVSAGLPKDLYPRIRDRFVALGRARAAAEAGNGVPAGDR